MKKKIKLGLDKLKVNSFLTSIHETEAYGMKGGATNVTGCTTEPIVCQFTQGTECQPTRPQDCIRTHPTICRTQHLTECVNTQPSICGITQTC